MNLTIDDKLSTMLLKSSKALGLEVSQVLNDAITSYFKKLEIPEEDDSGIETDYSFDFSVKKHELSPKERSSLGKTQLKNASKAEQGDAKAQNVMGTYYESGNGIAKDYEKAIYWYTQSANQGNSNAQYHLAVLYNKVEENPLKAYYWFEVARLCGFNLTAIHQDYMLRLTEKLSARQIKFAQDEAQKKYEEITKDEA